MKDKEKQRRLHLLRHIPKSDPTSPAAGSSKDAPPPLDLSRVIASSSRRRSPSHTAVSSRFGFESKVDSIFKPKINRTASAGSARQQRQSTFDESSAMMSGSVPPSGTPVGMAASSPTAGTPSGVLTPKASRVSTNAGGPPAKAKSNFRFAHESFRARMLQVFMTKKRTADTPIERIQGRRSEQVHREIVRDQGRQRANIQNEFGVCGYLLTVLSFVLAFFTLPFSACFCIKVVQEYERAVEILSKDSVTVAVDAVVYFRISNATISVTNVEDCSRSTKLLAQTTLRNILGTKTLAEMLSDREAVSLLIQGTLDDATEPVERVEVKDIRLPVQLQRHVVFFCSKARTT
ncbi:Band 7 protein family and Stomatin family-containing protein, protein [Aphelenchoides fujianensis]|nr:Band 7 protein family and Stomatin family-containing protein, protein [Aphelenchoides fujianensis]